MQSYFGMFESRIEAVEAQLVHRTYRVGLLQSKIPCASRVRWAIGRRIWRLYEVATRESTRRSFKVADDVVERKMIRSGTRQGKEME